MLQVIGVSKIYGSKTVLENVSFSVSGRQRVGLIGPNGAGKSTLFKIILGEEQADSGQVLCSGKIGFLPQTLSFRDTDTIESYLASFVTEEWEVYRIPEVLHVVGLDVALDSHVSSLSGGQKTRLGIARLLMEEADILLLDEPTNNLDRDGLKWLEQFVRKFSGAVLVISHDRKFLDNVIQKIFELDPYTHQLSLYDGGYTAYVEEKAKRYSLQLAAYQDYEDRRKEMEEWIALMRQKLSNHADPKGGKRLRAMVTRYERDVSQNKVDKPRENATIGLNGLGSESHKKKIVYYLEDVGFKDLFHIEKLSLRGGDRIQLEGANGVGKSTLIRILRGEITSYTGTCEKGEGVGVGYFAQEHEMLDFNNTLIKELLRHTTIGNEGRARSVLGKFLFSGVQVYNTVGSLSQGERVKLVAAILTNQENQFLLLDEPTNHLDLPSREVLEQALYDFEGGFLVVSHDRYFLEQIGINRELCVENHRIVEKKFVD